jgi:Do/DeqQ family serine protease
MLEHVTPAVVNISVEKEDETSKSGHTFAVGSGVVIDAEKGYIITNDHIVSHQKVIVATLKDGRRYRAHLIGASQGFDLAVIQINAQHLKAMPMGNSSVAKVGDFVVAIGSPFGLSQTVTSGVISALNRSTPKIEGFQNFIQTDASINPGNSGGALCNMRGQLIGINTAIITPSAGNIGIGFAIPSNTVQIIAEQLIHYGRVSSSILGVMAQDLTPELADAMTLNTNSGILVTDVLANSPADQAGLKSEDVITQINQDIIHNSAELHNFMGVTHPGTSLTIHFIRAHQHQLKTLKAGDPNEPLAHDEMPFLSGLRLQSFSDLEPDSSEIQGAMVLAVNDNSAGALAGLEAGDIIVKANGKTIVSINDLVAAAQSAQQSLVLKVIRDNTNAFLVIQRDQ